MEGDGIACGFPGKTPEVRLYIIEGHGHHRPGGKLALFVSLAGKNTAKRGCNDTGNCFAITL
jgi:hypothetical protein